MVNDAFDLMGNLYGTSSLSGRDSDWGMNHTHDIDRDVNPANGLPTMDSVIDVMGNPCGTNFNHIGDGDFHSGLGFGSDF